MDDTHEVSRWTGRVGAFAGPVLALLVYFLLPEAVYGEDGKTLVSGLAHPARALAGVVALMAVWWMTEAAPLAATSLLPIVLFPLLGVAKISEAAAPFADPFIFLFMGGFMLALTVERWGLHRRIALRTVLTAGARQSSLVGGMMAATAFLSMWLSNTATAAMMIPIAISLVALARERAGESAEARASIGRFSAALMLGVAYAASIGGMGTPVGTPPNLVLIAYLERTSDVRIGFVDWMLMAVPLVVVFTVVTWLLLTRVLHPVGGGEIPGGREMVKGQLRELGPMSRGEWIALGAFALACAGWIARSLLPEWAWFGAHAPGGAAIVAALQALGDPGVALLAAVALFFIPVDARAGVYALDWETAKKLPWDVLLLFGGGLSLGAMMKPTGLDAWIGAQVAGLGALPIVLLVAALALIVVALSEIASNTATATTFLPIVGGVAAGAGIEPLILLVPAALAASCGFMLPVATPPNAIAFGTGEVRMGQMVRAGLLLDLIGVGLITATVFTTMRWLG